LPLTQAPDFRPQTWVLGLSQSWCAASESVRAQLWLIDRVDA